MKKLIGAILIIVCLALCAAAWPQGEVVGETHKPMPATAVNTPEAPVTAAKEEAEVLTHTEKENPIFMQLELLSGTVPEPGPVPAETPIAPEVQPIPEPKPASEPVPDSVPAQPVIDPQPSNMFYVPGLGWLESQGEGTVIYDDMMYENGNNVGIMETSE